MIDDKSLREVLKQKIKNIKEYPRSVQKKVEFEMASKYNVKFGDTVDIFNDIPPYSVDELSYDMLFKLAKSIHEVAINSDQRIDASDLYMEKYFTSSEISMYNSPYPEEEKDSDLVITDWKQMSENKIKIYTNIDEVIQWRNYKKLRFNPETQRDLITVVTNGKKVKKLDINRNAINEMKGLMKKGMYYNVCGILNINPEFSPLPYKEGKNLIIPKEANIDIIEGFHNYLAATELKDEDSSFSFDMEFNLMLLSTEEANDLIIQMDKKTHLRAGQVARNDRLNEVNYVINNLNTRPSFHLYGTIDNDTKLYLNKLLTKLYGSITNRAASLNLIKTLEKNLNIIIENKQHFQPFTMNEYFVYLNLIKHADKNKLDFADMINKIDLDLLFKQTKAYTPTPANLKNIEIKINEVVKNVI